jgi:iron complex outermembrane receptor protein
MYTDLYTSFKTLIRNSNSLSIKKITLSVLILLSGFSVHAQQQTYSITGSVSTVDGQPVPYVSVVLSGKSLGAKTQHDGTFTLNKVKAGSYIIKVTAIGLATQQKSITVPATTVVNFVLAETNDQLQEVVIGGKSNTNLAQTGSKIPLRDLENAQVYSSIGKELLASQLVFSVDDAMRNAPGVAKMWEATGRSGDGGAYYNSRGFVVQSQLRNGIAGNISGRIDASNIESIQVIKGPNATLYGSTNLTSYGAIVNRITKKPYDHFGAELSYTAGSFAYNRLSADVNTPLDQDKNVLFRLNTAYTSENSWQDNGFNRNFAFSPSLTYKVSDKLSFQLDAEFYSTKGTQNMLIFFPYLTSTGELTSRRANELMIDYKRAFFAEDLTQQSLNSSFFATMDYKISGQWTSQTIASATNSFSDGAGPYFYLLPNNQMQRKDQFTDHSKVNVLELQQNFNGDFKLGDLRNRFVGGLGYYSYNDDEVFHDAAFDVVNTYGDVSGYNSFNRRNLDALYQDPTKYSTYSPIFKANTYSAYASDVLNLTEQLAVQAGLRIDYYDRKGAFNSITGLRGEGYSQTTLSPKFGLVYEFIKDQFSLFGNYQNGFKNIQGQDINQKAFRAEQANQIEAGVKLDLFEGKLSSTLSYYDIKVQDLVRADLANPGFSIQDGTQKSKGFEAELRAAPIQNLSLLAGFAYNDSKMVKASAEVEGRRPTTASSPYVANLWASYRIPVQGNGLNIGFGGNYASDNRVVNTKSLGVYTLPAYTVFNAAITYDTPKFRIGLKADNLSNRHYWIGWGSMNPQKLRSILGSISFKF